MTPASSPPSPHMPRFLHVANGLSTTRTIEAAGIPGICSIWADPLHEGPVPGGLTDAELTQVRAAFLSGSHGGPAIWAGDDPALDPRNDLRAWRAVIENHTSYDELVLWYEHDLFDQLNLIQVLSWIRGRVPSRTLVSLVCIGSFPGRPRFKGLGELTAAELAPLLDTRAVVSDAQYGLAARAWDAFREPTPEALDRLRRGGTSALPFLAGALTRFLQEYPWTSDGLSRSERRLLQLAADDGTMLSAAFPRMDDGEQAYHMSDSSLAAIAWSLASASPPLLSLQFPDAAGGHTLRGRIALTDTGRAVLAGTVDRVDACGIDRWMGGVHLRTGSSMWRWDDAQQRVRPTS